MRAKSRIEGSVEFVGSREMVVSKFSEVVSRFVVLFETFPAKNIFCDVASDKDQDAV